jgi:hypothetical protein
MGFDTENKKHKTMTTKDQMDRKVTVVSTQSVNENETVQEAIPDAGSQNQEFVNQPVFTEAGHQINLDVLEDTPKEKTANASVAPQEEFVTTGTVPPSSKHINEMSWQELNNFMSASVVARPVRLPARLNARAKDPNMRLRWIEFKAEDGRRFRDAETMGFRTARPEEVVGLSTEVTTRADKTIVDHDLILMIIPAETINGYLKYNALRAMKMVSQFGSRRMAKQEGEATLRQGIAGEGININSPKMVDRFGNSKLEVYIPGGN